MSVDIGAIIEGGTGISEIIAGYMATEEASSKIKEHKKKYPEMQIPEAVVAATDLFRQESQKTTLAGQSLYEQQIGANTAQGVAQSREVATSAADLLGVTTSIYGQQNQALTQLQIEAARNQAQAKQMYGQQLNTLGSWQQQQYYMNQYYPWVSTLNELQGIQQSGYDMLVGGINTLAASGANYGGSGGSAPVTNSNAMTNTQGYGVAGIDPAMNNLNLQATQTQTLGQNQYNPSGGQTLGQYTYNPNNKLTLGTDLNYYGGGK